MCIRDRIYTKELSASLDEKNQSVKLDVNEYSKLQKLCLGMLDKLQTTITINERIFDGKVGNYGYLEKELLENALKKKQQNKKKFNNPYHQNKKMGKRRF
eukprot:TRINITY_DN469_c0_g1_i3.p4 TRINITY_DN469_c0_g1~~TRINITY_DN469_c0_g1_i3.p4  ORF type:complete len:100 (-),score=24.15 TRINITY_DN469_c0_g1_i3:177-476(-)